MAWLTPIREENFDYTALVSFELKKKKKEKSIVTYISFEPKQAQILRQLRFLGDLRSLTLYMNTNLESETKHVY